MYINSLIISLKTLSVIVNFGSDLFKKLDSDPDLHSEAGSGTWPRGTNLILINVDPDPKKKLVGTNNNCFNAILYAQVHLQVNF